MTASELVQNLHKLRINGGRQMILDREQRRNRFRALVLQRIDGSTELDDNGLRLLIENVIRAHCRKESLTIRERRETKKDVFDSLRRLDVLQDLMEDGMHEAIISKSEFDLVQELLLRDTRVAPEKSEVFPLAGMVYCADCGEPMVSISE